MLSALCRLPSVLKHHTKQAPVCYVSSAYCRAPKHRFFHYSSFTNTHDLLFRAQCGHQEHFIFFSAPVRDIIGMWLKFQECPADWECQRNCNKSWFIIKPSTGLSCKCHICKVIKTSGDFYSDMHYGHTPNIHNVAKKKHIHFRVNKQCVLLRKLWRKSTAFTDFFCELHMQIS